MPERLPDQAPTHAVARWRLPDRPSLERLRKQAKELRRRAAAGDADALALVDEYDAGGDPITLVRCQRVLARAYGFPGWSGLRAHLAVLDSWGREMAATVDGDSRVDAFLRAACLTYSEPQHAGRALTMLADDPGLATASAATMAACGAADDLADLLARDPAAVDRLDGPHRWPSLLYLCYARLGRGDSVATAKVLLEAGADPNAGFLWQWLPSPFTAVTGVLGGGERDEPPHPDGVALATLLLDAGADPNDNQALYNRQFRADDSHLGPLLEHGVGQPQPSPWRDRLGSAYPSPAEMLGEHLRTAAAAGFIERVRRLLAYGVDPGTRGYHPTLGDQTAYEVAVRNGHLDTADLLAAAGATSDRLDEVDRLLAAALGGDEATVQRLASHASTLVSRRPDALRVAGEHHDSGAVERLLQLGFVVDATGADKRTALHEAALRGDERFCVWLLARGADPTSRDRDFDGTPADWAAHAGHAELAELLRSGMTG